MTVYFVCRFGLDEDYNITDYEDDIGEFDNVTEAKELFDKCEENYLDYCFAETPHTEIVLEECEKDFEGNISTLDYIDQFSY